MASFPKTISSISLYLLFLSISTQTHLSSSLNNHKIEQKHLSLPLKSIDIHDLMPQYGFPKGLLPNNVKSYTLSVDGSFEIELENKCYVEFEMLVYYDKKIKGKLSYGFVSNVSGIQAKKLFLWVSVTEIKANKDSGTIEFDAGFLSETLPAKQFDKIRGCKRNAFLGQMVEAM